MERMQEGCRALMQPTQWRGGLERPVFSGEGAQLSLQLASLAYSLDVDAWRREGWTDVSYHVDNALLTGEDANGGSGGRLPGLMSEYKQFMTRLKARSTNLIGQVLGTVRQKEQSDTCKAVAMIKQQEDGRYLVAIGFMGTGKRLYDWIANFRFSDEEGLHQGCLQLTRHFEESLKEIVFQKTAAELGLERLTLEDILLECTRKDSRFKLWLAGHSQGAAVMQVFAYRAIRQGVLRQNLIGYGFASPSVLYGEAKMDVRSIPLFHLLNGDDLVCRLGARVHMGTCFVAVPAEEMRSACYGNVWQDPSFRQVFALVQRVRGNQDALLFLLSLIRAFSALDDTETVKAVSAMLARILPERISSALGGRMENGLRFLRRYVERTYYATTGRRYLPKGTIRVLAARMEALIARTGPKVFLRYLLQSMSIPHRMRNKAAYGNAVPAYAYMAKRAPEGLQNAITSYHPPAGKAARQALRQKRKKVWGRFGRRI